MSRVCSIVFVIILLGTAVLLQAQEDVIYLRAGKLFDGISDHLRNDVVIVVEENKIVSVGKDIAIPAGAKTIDLSGMTVLSAG